MKQLIRWQSMQGHWLGKVISGEPKFSIDSRQIQPGMVYVALRGEQHDGHDFVADAFSRGAAAAVVEADYSMLGPCFVVMDTGIALLELAQFYRQTYSVPMVAITGSCGKTTIRLMLQNILSSHFKVLASQASYNNRIGVPLTLMRLDKDHYDCIVQEVGANHHTEIAEIVAYVQPDSVIISNAAPCHLAGFGDMDGVCRAKGEILDRPSIHADRALAILNADDVYFDTWYQRAQAAGWEVRSFGLSAGAHVRGSLIEIKDQSLSFQVNCDSNQVLVHLPMLGEHNVMNALASIALATGWGVPLVDAAKALATISGESQRLQQYTGVGGAVIIDDSFNANPRSMFSAIEVLSRRSGTRIFIAGDMAELGDHALDYHSQVALAAVQAGIDRLYCVGKQSQVMLDVFPAAEHFSSNQTLIEAVLPLMSSNTHVLVKGSHAMHMNEIVKALTKAEE